MVILTIAHHTLREAIRKRVFYVLIGLCILITFISLVIPTTDEPNARIKIILVVFFQVVVLLCIIGVILISALSLPSEIEDKTIYSILSKPISKLSIIIGKIIGFALLSALILAILGALNIIILQQAVVRLPEGCKDILKARNEFTVSKFDIQGKLHHIREGTVWIEGGRTGIAVWNFSHVCEKPDSKSYFEAELSPKIESTGKFADSIPLVVRLEGVGSDHYRTEVISIKADEPFLLKLDTGIIQKSSNINISLFPLNTTDHIGVTADDVKVFFVKKGFLLNYIKAGIITFLKFLLIVIITVMGSTYLSAPVSIVSSLIVFLCGHILDFIKDFSFLIQYQGVHEHALPTVMRKPGVFFVYLDSCMKKILEWFSVVLPDFNRYDSLEFLLKGINIPLKTIVISFGYTALYAVICLFISFFVFKRREFL
ncbi:MAG: hypothetical protein E3K32_01090 [wastewater metagenome]|nr:hypothetical protein [Candidatus Loosdrechtia aerotolerans]